MTDYRSGEKCHSDDLQVQLDAVIAERDALRQQIDDARKQAPVAWKCPDCGNGQEFNHRGCDLHFHWNRNIRDSVDNLLRLAGYAEESSARHQLAMMRFDGFREAAPVAPVQQGENNGSM